MDRVTNLDFNKDLSMNTIKFYHRQKEYIVQSQNINQHTFNKNYNKVLALLNENEIKSINECELIPAGKTDILKLSAMGSDGLIQEFELRLENVY